MLKGLRFQKRLRIFPGLRINLSKSGASTTLGPRGAGVNIGKDGITTNAGIPGTGLSYRRKLGGGRGWLGVVLLVAALGWWAFQNKDVIASYLATPGVQTGAQMGLHAPVNTGTPGLRYVRRDGSVIREEPSTSAMTLKKESKGSQVGLIQEDGRGWAKVTDGNITGWMRSSTLATTRP
jgi:hypothetical protein